MTSTKPTRATVAGRAYLDLRNLARREGRPTDELHQMYALEGFLSRLAISDYSHQLILKGGVLLAAYDARRPTRDIDFQAERFSNDVDDVLDVACKIVRIHHDDGLTIDAAGATAATIRDGAHYHGVRVNFTGRLASAEIAFHVDVSVGDPIWPEPQAVEVPRLLGGHLTLTGYPLPMVFAEKIATCVERGTANTRWRDFADIYLLANHHDVQGATVRTALVTVANHRGVTLVPLRESLDGFPRRASRDWAAWRRRQRLDTRLPADFGDVLDAVVAFADPVINDRVGDATWHPRQQQWMRSAADGA